jgi:hypothetical protein
MASDSSSVMAMSCINWECSGQKVADTGADGMVVVSTVARLRLAWNSRHVLMFHFSGNDRAESVDSNLEYHGGEPCSLLYSRGVWDDGGDYGVCGALEAGQR